MRVLHVSQTGEGGVAYLVADHLRWQVEQGWDVVFAGPPGKLADLAAAAGVEVVDWRAHRSPHRSVAPEARALNRILRAHRPDLVHLHSSKAGLVGRLAIRGRIPTLFMPHAWSFFHARGLLRSAAVGWERYAARWCDRIVATSEAERRTGLDVGIQARWQVVSTAIDVGKAAQLSREEARELLQVAPETPLAVCVGRLCEQKGQDVLLHAWRQVRPAVSGAELALVGDGPEGQRLREQAAGLQGLRWVGWSERDTVLTWVRAADLVVAPSRWDSHSLAILEAVALGRPVVATDVDGAREAVGDSGRIVPVGQVEPLASAVLDLLSDPECAREAGRAAAEVAAGRSGRVQQNCAAMADLYREVLAERRVQAGCRPRG